jgi:hypothetical protein
MTFERTEDAKVDASYPRSVYRSIGSLRPRNGTEEIRLLDW